MKVTLDIPEGYEAKVVATEHAKKRVLEFTLPEPDQEDAEAILTVITPIFMRAGADCICIRLRLPARAGRNIQ